MKIDRIALDTAEVRHVYGMVSESGGKGVGISVIILGRIAKALGAKMFSGHHFLLRKFCPGKT